MKPFEQKENIILVDWFSFTGSIDDPFYYIILLGLDDLKWQEGKGHNGYMNRKWCDHISIHYGGINPGCWVELSGQGCRCWESFSSFRGDWIKLFKIILEGDYHVTRLDLAYDDFSHLISLEDIERQIRSDHYVSKASFWECVVSSKGMSSYIGSPSSDIRLRIYDKAAERGYQGEYWNRFEIQLRDDRALNLLRQAIDIPSAFKDCLFSYIRFVDPLGNDSNKSRWPVSEWYSKLVGSANHIKLVSPGAEYNLENLQNFVINNAGDAIDTLVNILGWDALIDMIHEKQITRVNPKNPKYIDLENRFS